jgi:photosystem II stability/assembly factor-like uncharacterized protein
MKPINNKTISVITIFFIFLISSGNGFGQWVSTQGPGGGRITSLMKWNNYIYTGTSYGQVYKSMDNGDTWQNSSSGLPTNSNEILSLTANNFGIYALSYTNGINFSLNEGVSWTHIELAGIISIHGYGNSLFAGTSFGELYMSSNGGATWNSANSGIPQGTSITHFASKDNYIFAGTSSGIFKSTNNGTFWTPTSAPNTGITAMAFKGDTLMFGYRTINYSTDFGSSWQNFNLGGNFFIYSFASSGSTILAGSFHGIYISSNSGQTWSFEKINNILNTFETKGIIYTNGRFLSGSDAGIYVSTNGQSWQPSNFGLTSLYANRLVSAGNDLYAHLWGNGGGLHLSTNNGANWAPLNTSTPIIHVQFILPVEDRIFIATIFGAYVTTDKGTNWLPINNGLTDQIVYTLAFNNGKLYAGTQDHGIFMSTNYGNSWNNISGTLPSQYVRGITFRGNNIFAGTAMGIYISSDGGSSWESRNSGINYPYLDKLYSYRNKIYATTQEFRLYSSTNEGMSWTEMTNGLPTYKFSLFFMRNYVFMGTNEGVYMSTNNGTNWSAINQGFPSGQEAIRAIIKDYCLYAGTKIDGVWKRPLREVLPHYSVSGQVKYKDNNLPVNQGKIRALAYDENTGNIIVVDSAQIQPGGLYTLPHVPMDSLFIMAYPDDEFDFVPTYYPSTIDWRLAEVIYPEENLNNINVSVYRINNSSNQFSISGGVYKNSGYNFPISDAIIYVKSGNDFKNFGISGYGGLYSASSLSPGTYTLICYRIGYNSASTTAAITSSNLESINFHLSNNLIPVEPPGPMFPDKYNLYQNYPNPFNPLTKINYDLPRSSYINLTVYDILGREVISLVQNEFQKEGRYSVEFNASNLASGVYFYRIEAGDFVESRKMLLVK